MFVCTATWLLLRCLCLIFSSLRRLFPCPPSFPTQADAKRLEKVTKLLFPSPSRRILSSGAERQPMSGFTRFRSMIVNWNKGRCHGNVRVLPPNFAPWHSRFDSSLPSIECADFSRCLGTVLMQECEGSLSISETPLTWSVGCLYFGWFGSQTRTFSMQPQYLGPIAVPSQLLLLNRSCSNKDW